MQSLLKAKLERRSSNGTKYLVIWWMSKSPYAAVFTNRVAAEAAANVRNAILVAIKGDATKVEEVVDWYRRDAEGRPMPAEWRAMMGQVHVQWHATARRPPSRSRPDRKEACANLQTSNKEWIRRSRSGSRGPFYLAKTSNCCWRSLGGDPSAGSPTDTLFTGSPCRHGAWTVSSSDARASEPGVQSLRVPVLRPAFPADCPHLRIFTYARYAYVSQDPRSSPHIARFVPVPCGSGVATHVYDLALLAEPRF